jgi:hypothetical protein
LKTEITSLEDSPTSEEDDNKGGHPNTKETTSLNGAPTPSIFSPTYWDDEREDHQLQSKE